MSDAAGCFDAIARRIGQTTMVALDAAQKFSGAILSVVLAHRGYDRPGGRSGPRQQGYARRPEGKPAVVLMDLKLPKVAGPEALKEIRECEELRSLPVVMLTSSTEEQDLVRSYQLGVSAHVVKPVDFRDFIEAIADLGMFRAVLDEPPPEHARVLRRK